ncbi:MAG TPA: nuclear transport factor 2 family protein [Pyrinomonadaceae bacterium]|nr:nuclear transport factor 2 family protein [Pyrinomonadaceae bacterium]
MKLVISLFLIIGVAAIARSQTPLQEMVKTEQAFSKMAEEKTAREAFMAFIADDGLLFRPGAVNGKKWMLEHPLPPSNKKKPLLAWQPSFAGMALAGDLGFTTGPSEFKEDINDKKPAWYGHFVTLWKKQADGSWKFVVDLGIQHPKSGGSLKLWTPKDKPGKTDFISGLVKPEDLIEKDRRFAAAAAQGLFPAFLSFAAPDIRLYRPNSLPYIGIEKSANAFTSIKGNLTWTPIGADVSRSGDLGYTHGTYEITAPDGTEKVIERGSYVRIWRAEPGFAMRVVLDVTNAH